MSTPPRTCANCGRRVKSSGRRAADDVYFCKEKPCRAAKARHYYHANAGVPRSDAPTTCACCGTSLKPRKVRQGDSPTGLRWCNRAPCRNDRRVRDQRVTAATAAEAVDPRILERLVYLHRALALPRVTCPSCGVEDAVDGYPHPDQFQERCTGTGEEWAALDDVKATFPNYAGLPATLVDD